MLTSGPRSPAPAVEAAPPLPSSRPPPSAPPIIVSTPPRPNQEGRNSSDSPFQTKPGERRWLSPQKAPVLERGHSAPLVLRPQRVPRVVPRVQRSVTDTGSVTVEDGLAEDLDAAQATTPRAAERKPTTSVSSLESASSTSAVSCSSGTASSQSSSSPSKAKNASQTSSSPAADFVPPFAATLLSNISSPSRQNSSERIVSLNVGGTVYMVGLEWLLGTPSRLEEWLRDKLEDQGRETITFGGNQGDTSPTLNCNSQRPPYERPCNLPSRYASMSELAKALEKTRKTMEPTIKDGSPEAKSVVYEVSRANSMHPTLEAIESPIDRFMHDPLQQNPTGQPTYRRRPSSSYTLTPSPKNSLDSAESYVTRRRPSTTAFPQTATSSAFFSDLASLGHRAPSELSFQEEFPRTPTDVGHPFPLAVGEDHDSAEEVQVLSPMRLLDFGASKDKQDNASPTSDQALDDVETARRILSPTRIVKATENRTSTPKSTLSASAGPIEVFLDRSAAPYPAILHFLRHSASLPKWYSLTQLLPHSHRLPVELLALSPTDGTCPPFLANQLFDLHAKLLELRDEAAWLGMEFLRAVVEAEARSVKRALLGGSAPSQSAGSSRVGWI